MTESRIANRVVGVLGHLAVSILIAVAAATITLGTRTVESAYSGTRLGIAENRETGLATPKGCRRIGPISWHGFGYWWSCSVQVKMDDGRMLEIETEASMIRPGERDVPIVESCQKNRPAKCVYTQPGNFALAFGVRLLGMVTAAVGVIGAAAAIAVAIFALVGVRRGDAKAGQGNG